MHDEVCPSGCAGAKHLADRWSPAAIRDTTCLLPTFLRSCALQDYRDLRVKSPNLLISLYTFLLGT